MGHALSTVACQLGEDGFEGPDLRWGLGESSRWELILSVGYSGTELPRASLAVRWETGKGPGRALGLGALGP